jgi:hypothetical protein
VQAFPSSHFVPAEESVTVHLAVPLQVRVAQASEVHEMGVEAHAPWPSQWSPNVQAFPSSQTALYAAPVQSAVMTFTVAMFE